MNKLVLFQSSTPDTIYHCTCSFHWQLQEILTPCCKITNAIRACASAQVLALEHYGDGVERVGARSVVTDTVYRADPELLPGDGANP